MAVQALWMRPLEAWFLRLRVQTDGKSGFRKIKVGVAPTRYVISRLEQE